MSDSKSDVSAIDKAIAAARARKAAKGTDGSSNTNTAPKTPKADKGEATPKRPRLTDEEKAAREQARSEERAAKKAARDEARAAKRAERDNSKRTPHMSKVAKAAAKLPSLNDSAQVLFNDITANYSRDQVNAIALHLQHFNRVKATERALGQTIEAGMAVTIVGGDSRFVGQTGTVVKAQRIRCYVEVAGAKKPVYLFTSDVEPASAAAAARTA
jgi:flagellar biosynthesis GTPase FlhF